MENAILIRVIAQKVWVVYRIIPSAYFAYSVLCLNVRQRGLKVLREAGNYPKFFGQLSIRLLTY